MKRVRALLQPMGSVWVEDVNEAAVKVERAFPIDVSVKTVPWKIPPPLNAFNFGRLQYDAEIVVDHIYRHYRDTLVPGEVIVVGVVRGDGFVSGFNFVFGLADPGLGVAVVFTRRLEGPREVFIERMAKEIAHEMGHLLGLSHCSNARCVMSFSNTLEEVDRKSLWFCDSCSLKLVRRYGPRSLTSGGSRS